MSCWRVGRKNVCVCVCVERVRVATGARKTQSNNVLRLYVYLSRSLFASMNIYFSSSLRSRARLVDLDEQVTNQEILSLLSLPRSLSRLLAVFFSFSLSTNSLLARKRELNQSRHSHFFFFFFSY